MITTSRREVSIDRYNRLSGDGRDSSDELDDAKDEIKTKQSVRRFTMSDEDEYPKASVQTKLYGKESLDLDEAEPVFEGETSMPSARTLNYKSPTYLKRDAEQTIVSSVSKTKAKIAVAVYIAVILALAIAIAFTAVNVSAAFVSADELSGEMEVQTQTIDSLTAELSNVDEAALTAAAIELGFSLPNTTNTLMYDTPVTRGPQTFELTSNWFDKLCDGLCRLFGGN